MEIPGDVYKPFLGLVNQTTFAPVGRLLPWKMSRTILDFNPRIVPTDHNAVPDFSTNIRAKRKATGTIENACFDPAFNIFGFNPFGGLGVTHFFQDGLVIRALMVPNTAVVDPAYAGGSLGVPIFGAAGEVLTAGPLLGYIFMGLRISKIHHEGNAAEGQPFSFDFETTFPFCVPGESQVLISSYGYLAAANDGTNGGFL